MVIESLQHDQYALEVLQPLLNNDPYLPFSEFSLRPSHLVRVFNELVLNDRRLVIEFGSGISTILLGRLIKKNNLNTKVVAIDHDVNWVNKVNNLLRKEGTSTYINQGNRI